MYPKGKSVFVVRAGALLTFICFLGLGAVKAQQAAQDSTISQGEGIYSVFKKFENLKFSGYIQPQFQVAQSKGAPGFNGGNFSTHSNNRFMLRRGRIRMDYSLLNNAELPRIFFVFQFDVTERGVGIRDFYGKVYENKWSLFHVTTGMFSRPFGFEVNYSSAQREAPERGRMSQLLFRTERDLGAMVTLEPLRKHRLKPFRVEAGFFNGTGLAGPTDFDSHKDFIGRFSLKPFALSKYITVAGSISHYNGGLRQGARTSYRVQNGAAGFVADSADSHVGRKSPRIYYGADAQVKLNHTFGATELRGEYIQGTQTATAFTTESPALEPLVNNRPIPLFVRQFNGAYFYLVQDIKTNRHQLAFKYDWYDPNTDLAEKQIGVTGSRTTENDIRFDTFGVGYLRNFTNNVRFTLWYDWVRNRGTQLANYSADLKDNIFTARVMYRF